MKKVMICAALAAVAFANTAQAQDDPDKYYIRNSVYMIKLDETSSNPEYEEAYKIMNTAFDGIDFAKNYERYNDFALDVRHIDFSKTPEATQAEIEAIGKESKVEQMTREALVSAGLKNSRSEYEYAARLLKYFEENKFAQKLIAKWHNKPNTAIGKVAWDNDAQVIREFGLKGSSQDALLNAGNDGKMNLIAGKAAEIKLLNSTYVCVTRYSYLSAEDVLLVTEAIAQATLGSNALAQLAINKTMEFARKKIKGYFVQANAYLFKLEWDEDKFNDFYDKYWENPKDFMNAPYKLTYVGKSSKRAPATMSLKASATVDKLIARATQRGTDAAFAALQRDHENFRPMSSLHEFDGKLAAYVGMKEGIKSGDKFNVYMAVASEEDPNIMDWKSVGTIKVSKGGVWDNRPGAGENIEGAATDKDDDETGNGLEYTTFDGKPGKFGEGYMIRLAK